MSDDKNESWQESRKGNSDSTPEIVIAGVRATIRLCRPSQHNRLDPTDIEVLLEHFATITANADVRVLVVTGSGDRTFSSGYTIGAILHQLNDRFERMLDTLETLPIPVICALNGGVYGGSTDLALACDFRIGTPRCKMFMPAAKLGLHYYPGGIRRYVTRLGLTPAKKLFLTAQTINAEEMLRIGFLTELVESEKVDDTLDQYVQSIVACEPSVLAMMKRHLNQTAEGCFEPEAQRLAYEQSLKSEELKRRLAELGAP
jgi:enoyl-CoA hydratase/carnithine racemase